MSQHPHLALGDLCNVVVATECSITCVVNLFASVKRKNILWKLMRQCFCRRYRLTLLHSASTSACPAVHLRVGNAGPKFWLTGIWPIYRLHLPFTQWSTTLERQIPRIGGVHYHSVLATSFTHTLSPLRISSALFHFFSLHLPFFQSLSPGSGQGAWGVLLQPPSNVGTFWAWKR